MFTYHIESGYLRDFYVVVVCIQGFQKGQQSAVTPESVNDIYPLLQKLVNVRPDGFDVVDVWPNLNQAFFEVAILFH